MMAPDLMKPIQYFRPKVGKGLRSNTWQRYQTILLKIQIILWPYLIKLVNPPLRPWWSLSCFQFQRTQKWSGLPPSWVSSPGSTPNVVRSENKISNLNLTNFHDTGFIITLMGYKFFVKFMQDWIRTNFLKLCILNRERGINGTIEGARPNIYLVLKSEYEVSWK